MDKNSIELAIENSLIDRYSRTVKYKSQEYSVLISRVSIMFNIPSSELLRIISNISDGTSTEIAIKILTDIVSYSLPKTYSNFMRRPTRIIIQEMNTRIFYSGYLIKGQ